MHDLDKEIIKNEYNTGLVIHLARESETIEIFRWKRHSIRYED